MEMRARAWRRKAIGAPEPAVPGTDAPADAAGAAEAATAAEDSYARIERGVEMNGRLVTERPLRVEGEFRGEIQSASAVLVTESGAVEAPIRARTVEIRGAVVGDVVASREVVIHATGRLHGDVEAPSFVVTRGAFFIGRTRMYRPERSLALAEAPPVSQADAAPAPQVVAPAAEG